jgi:hypothetical protein
MTDFVPFTVTAAHRAAAPLFRAAYVARESTSGATTARTHARLVAMTDLLAAMDGHTTGVPYLTAVRDAVNAAPTTAPSDIGLAAHRAWADPIDARIATDLAMLAAGLDVERVRRIARDLATHTDPAELIAEARAEAASNSAARALWGRTILAAAALGHTARVTA